MNSVLLLLQVMMSEFLGSFLLTLIPRYVLEHATLANNDPTKILRGGIISLVVLCTVLAGMDHSGSMFNPTLATLLVGGCVGYTTTQHVLVYWVTPVIGAAVGTVLYTSMAGAEVGDKKHE